MKNILKLTAISLGLFVALAEEKSTSTPVPKSSIPPAELRAEWRKSQALAANAAVEFLLAEKKFIANNAGFQKSIESIEGKMRKFCEDANLSYAVDQDTQEPKCNPNPKVVQRSSIEGKK